MYPYGYPVPYYPGAHHPRQSPDPAPLSDAVKAAAKEAGARWISADGKLIYKRLFGRVLWAEFNGREGESWWPVEGELPAGVVEL